MDAAPAFERRPALRWVVPCVAVASIAGFAVLRPVVADAASGPDPLSARDLLVKAQQARPVPMSGTVRHSVDLGLPDLPASITGHPGTASLFSLLSGTTTLRVWYGGAHQARVSLLGQSSEVGITANGNTVWYWSSAEKTARQYLLPDHAAAHGKPANKTPAPRATDSRTTSPMKLKATDPATVADWILKHLDPTTTVQTTSLDRVAGRSVYGLVLTPKTSNSLIASAQLALDAETFTPLAVRINSTKLDKPAIDVSFTEVSFDKPANSVFEFSPPPQATVTTTDLTSASWQAKRPHGQPHTTPKNTPSAPLTEQPGPTRAPRSGDSASYRPVVTGSGWESIVVGRLPQQSASDDGDGTPNPLQALQWSLPPSSGPWGTGQVLDGTLVSVIITDDGRYAVGPVSAQALGNALASTR